MDFESVKLAFVIAAFALFFMVIICFSMPDFWDEVMVPKRRKNKKNKNKKKTSTKFPL